ncbi:MAG: hypothetical protein PHE18_08505 [Candidatus Omnitrophica bacterium]|nr:hypothetical protein [Candidatus Omnitrophota bacterium]
MEKILIILIVLAAAGILADAFIRALKGKNRPHCEGCGSFGACGCNGSINCKGK